MISRKERTLLVAVGALNRIGFGLLLDQAAGAHLSRLSTWAGMAGLARDLRCEEPPRRDRSQTAEMMQTTVRLMSGTSR